MDPGLGGEGRLERRRVGLGVEEGGKESDVFLFGYERESVCVVEGRERDLQDLFQPPLVRRAGLEVLPIVGSPDMDA